MTLKTTHYMLDGGSLTVHYLDVKGVHDIINEVFDEDCYHLHALHKSGFNPKIVVDVGAHMGFFSVLVHHYWPQATVISIEPDVDLLPALSANARVNLCCPCAIRYDNNDMFYVSPNTGGSMIYDPTINFTEKVPADYEKRRVPIKPFEVVDDWIHGAPIDLLKLDCEGSEFNILCGMPWETRERIKHIVGEFHHIAGWPYLEIILKTRFPHLKPVCLNTREQGSLGMFEA